MFHLLLCSPYARLSLAAPCRFSKKRLAEDRSLFTALLQLLPFHLVVSFGDAQSSIISACLAINPNHEMARNIRAAAYMCTGRHDDAIQDAKRILQLDPEDKITLKTIDDARNALKKN